MRIEYFEPKLEIIDLLDADIVTASQTESGDTIVDVGGILGNILNALTGGNDSWDDTSSDSWTGGSSWH